MSSMTKYTCPYCKKRFVREDLVRHLGYHRNSLPEGFTPLRMAYHIANRKDVKYRRACRICHLATDWDEKKGRYNFLCNKKSCHDAWVNQMNKNMGDKAGAFRPTSSPEGLEKMLAGRKISGKYKWSDGTEKVYTGSYEKKALEFFDKVLECKSEELQCPGPTMKYELDGQEHWYISDMYYAPYNLIIEVKDGGNRPNTNPNFALSRKKMLAKEEYIIKHTDYNYLRLTDNDFSQVLEIFAQLKLRLVEPGEKNRRKININEHMTPMDFAPMPGANDVVVVNYKSNNAFSDEEDYAVSDSPKFDTVFARNSIGELKKTDKKIFENCIYTPYIVHGVKQQVSNILSEKIGQFIPENFIYEAVFGHQPFTNDQITFEESAEEIIDIYQEQQKIDNYIQEQIFVDKYGMTASDRYTKSIIHWKGTYAKLLKSIKGYLSDIEYPQVKIEAINRTDNDLKKIDAGEQKIIRLEIDLNISTTDIKEYGSEVRRFKETFSSSNLRDYINNNSDIKVTKISNIKKFKSVSYIDITLDDNSTKQIMKEETDLMYTELCLEMFDGKKGKVKKFIDIVNQWLKEEGYNDLCIRSYGGFAKKFNAGEINKMGFYIGYKSLVTGMKSNYGLKGKEGKEKKEYLNNDRLVSFIRTKFNEAKLMKYINDHTDFKVKKIKRMSSATFLIYIE